MLFKLISSKNSSNSVFLKLPDSIGKMKQFQSAIFDGNAATANVAVIIEAMSKNLAKFPKGKLLSPEHKPIPLSINSTELTMLKK